MTKPESAPVITPEMIATFQRDGVLVVRNAVSQDWVRRMIEITNQQMDSPGQWVNDQPEDDSKGRLFTDRYLWPVNPQIKAFAMDSGVAAIAGQLMESQYCRLYFDHLLVKEPGTSARTPWHQDVPYWPFGGKKIASSWVALSDVSVAESAMEFVRGSHSDGTYYAPAVFGDPAKSASTGWQTQSESEPVPDIEANRQDFDIVGWDMKAGDAVFFSAWLLHGACGNASPDKRRMAISIRWLGDDAIWSPHPGSDPTVTQADVNVEPGALASDDTRFPVAWKAASEPTNQPIETNL